MTMSLFSAKPKCFFFLYNYRAVLLFSATVMSATPCTCVSCLQSSEASNFLGPGREGTKCSVRDTEARLPISLREGQEMTVIIAKDQKRRFFFKKATI